MAENERSMSANARLTWTAVLVLGAAGWLLHLVPGRRFDVRLGDGNRIVKIDTFTGRSWTWLPGREGRGPGFYEVVDR